jgi:hypothetical protein
MKWLKRSVAFAARPIYTGGSNVLLKPAFTCFRWHKANGELNMKGISMYPVYCDRKRVRERQFTMIAFGVRFEFLVN